MLKYGLICPLLIIGFIGIWKGPALGQTQSGTVVYSSRIKLNGTTIYSDTLRFNRKKSIFRWYLQSQTSLSMKKFRRKYSTAKVTTMKLGHNDKIGRINLYNAMTDSLYSRKFIVDQVYLIKEKPGIHWTIADSTKKTGEFICTKATTHFRGRDYTAWFTPRIPVPYGPWKLVGLPRLIMQANDAKKNITFKAQKVAFKHVGRLGSMPLSGKEEVINLMQYKKIMTHLKKRELQSAHKAFRKVHKKLRRKYPKADLKTLNLKYLNRNRWKSLRKRKIDMSKLCFALAFLSALLALISIRQPKASAQQTGGIVVYQQKIYLSGPDIQSDTLRFNRTKSIFRWYKSNYSDAYIEMRNKEFKKIIRMLYPARYLSILEQQSITGFG